MKIIICVFLLMIMLTGGVRAGETVTLDSLVMEARGNNPDLKAARARWEASKKRPTQEGTLPDPSIGVRWQNVTFDSITLDEIPMSMLRLSFSQEIPFPGKLSAKENIASREAEAKGESYRATERQIIADLKTAYYDWYLTVKAIEITKRSTKVLQKFTKIAEVKYEVGKGIQQDVLKAQVENSKYIEQLEILEQRKKIIEAKIRSILNRPPDSALGSPEDIEITPLALTSDEIDKLTEDNAPLLAVREKLIEREEEALKLAKKELYPDFFVGGSPGIMGKEGNGIQGVWEVELGLRLPLYFWRKQKPGIEEAALDLEGAKEEYTSTDQTLTFNVKDNYLQARTAENLMRLYKNGIIPQSRLSLESAVSGYQVGSVDFLTLLDNLITLYSFELEYERQLTEYQKALARIEEYSGIDLNAGAQQQMEDAQ